MLISYLNFIIFVSTLRSVFHFTILLNVMREYSKIIKPLYLSLLYFAADSLTGRLARDIFQVDSLAKMRARKMKSREIRGVRESDFTGNSRGAITKY